MNATDMADWSLEVHQIALVRNIPLPQSRNTRIGIESSYSVIEQNGLQSALVIHFNTDCSSVGATIIFPTILCDPRDPRGYRSVQVPLPKLPKPPTKVSYDGNALRLTNQSLYSMSVFVSPSHPTVWCIMDFGRSQVSEGEVNMAKRSVICSRTPVVWKDERWTRPNRLDIAYTVLDEKTLSAAASDFVERRRLTAIWSRGIHFDCPNKEISTLCHFARIRLNEALFDAPNIGRVHSPGGGMYYSGVWCNDQAEYAAPVLAMLGGHKSRAREAAIHSLEVIARWFDYGSNFIPYSVEIDGGYIGALDRGDAAMFAWGASLTLLTVGDPTVTARLFPHITFASNIILEKIRQCRHGVVPSQSDELEGRYPTGEINLSVNCISVLALECASEAALEAGKRILAEKYASASQELRFNVHKYFQVSDSKIYEYYKSCPDSRGWACLTALAGLSEGKEALRYSLVDLWRTDGVLTSSDSGEVWDRCTLYAIRAAFQSGLVELGIQRFIEYATRTTTGPAAPFAVENNGSRAQLSAESGLVLRIITEGMLGLKILAGGEIELRPISIIDWPVYSVTGIYIRDVCLDFSVRHCDSGDMELTAFCGDWKDSCHLREGQRVRVVLRDITTANASSGKSKLRVMT